MARANNALQRTFARRGDRTERPFILLLKQPICARPDSASWEGQHLERNIRQVQLIILDD
jgi:hypothetical protein